MNAREYFQSTVMPSYTRFQRQGDFNSLQNAIRSMDSAAEYLALDRLKSAQVSRKALNQETRNIRGKFSSLRDVHSYSNTLKHVRSITDYRVASSKQLEHPLPSTSMIRQRAKARATLTLRKYFIAALRHSAVFQY